MKRPTWDEYRQQKAEMEFGNYFTVSELVFKSEQNISMVLDELAKSLSEVIFIAGYKAKRPLNNGNAALIVTRPGLGNPLRRYSNIGASMYADLKASPEQFIAACQHYTAWLEAEMEFRLTWRGFIRYRWQLLVSKFKKGPLGE